MDVDATPTWVQIRAGLFAVRRAVASGALAAPAARSKSLRTLAEHPLFAGLTTPPLWHGAATLDGGRTSAGGAAGIRRTSAFDHADVLTARGAAIALHVQHVVSRAADTWSEPGQDVTPTDGEFCLSLWVAVVRDGSTITDLARRHAPPRSTDNDRRRYAGRLKSLMSAGGNRESVQTQSAIDHLRRSLAANLEGNIVQGTFSPSGASATLAWRGLKQRQDQAAQELLRTVACSDHDVDFPVELLRDNPGPLLPALRAAAKDGPALRRLIQSTTATGLLTTNTTRDGATTVRLTPDAPAAVADSTTGQESREAAASLLRCLTIGIPAAAHEQPTWARWERLLPHVLGCVYQCVEAGIRNEDCVYLLERAAVFLRCGRIDPEGGIVIGEQALALADAAGIRDPEDYANVLGNLGICVRQLGRADDAVEYLRRAAEMTSGTGLETYQHVESLVTLADAYGSAGRHDHAEATFEQASRIAEESFSDRNDSENRAVLVESLNDFALHLLLHSDARRAREARYQHAADMLDRALELTQRGDYAWTSIIINRAEAHLRMGQFTEGINLLNRELPPCELRFGRNSYPYFSMVLGMAELQEAAGNKVEADRLFDLAHDIDDQLPAPDQGRRQPSGG